MLGGKGQGFYTGPAPGRPNTVQQVEPLWKTSSTAEFALRLPPSRAASAPGVLRDENGRKCISKDVKVPLTWWGGKCQSLSRESFVDHTPLRAVAKAHKTPVDFQTDDTWKRALGDQVPMTSISRSMETFKDYSGHKEALKKSPTVYSQRDELTKIRMSMEHKQRMQRKAARGFRPRGLFALREGPDPGETCSDEFKFFTPQDLMNARNPPCFTATHQMILRPLSPEVMTLCKDMTGSIGSARQSPCKRKKTVSPRRK